MRSYNSSMTALVAASLTLSLCLCASPAFAQVCNGTVTVTGDNLGAAIPPPEATPATYLDWPTTSDVVIAGDGWVTDVNVLVNVTHAADEDIYMVLVSPASTEIDLVVHRGGSFNNFIVTIFDDEAAVPITSGSPPFNGSFQPEEPLSTFDGELAGGTWALEIYDWWPPSDFGTLNNVEVTVTFADLDQDGDASFVCEDEDCDDAEPLAFPGNPEVCGDGIDNDCTGFVDDDPDCSDDDGDGWPEYLGDCDDAEPLAFPGNPEVCGDGIDNDCDSVVDEDVDADGDGVPLCGPDGVPGNPDDDCDDANVNINPSAPELCDGLDNDCDGSVPSNELDSDGDSYMPCEGDCQEGNSSVFPGAPESCDSTDSDCDTDLVDGFANNDADSQPDCVDADDDNDGDPDITDCSDLNASIYNGAPEVPDDGVDQDCNGSDTVTCFVDADQDGFGTTSTVLAGDGQCEMAEQESGNSDDCDDTNPNVNPSLPEACDGLDTDCDGSVPSNEQDLDGDGFMPCEGDCQEGNSSVFPGAPESCDSTDSDCDTDLVDGFTDSDIDGQPDCVDPDDDNDGDPDTSDCSDLNASIYNGAPEVPDDGVDQDCNGSDTVTCFVDADQDGFGDASTVLAGDGQCEMAEQESGNSDDCDDAVNTVYPGAPEACDGLDTDCDGSVPSNELDSDGDGFSECEGDCSDSEADRFPGNTEICDAIDNDCSLDLPLDEQDLDGDQWMACEGDCSDNPFEDPFANQVNPGEADVPNDGLDNDCSGAETVTCSVDADEDLFGDLGGATVTSEFGTCLFVGMVDLDLATDCNDSDPTVFPGATEACDSVDSDCDGDLVDGFSNNDADGQPDCVDPDDDNDGEPDITDCSSMDPTIYNGAPELPDDGVDQDCNGFDTVTCSVDADEDLFGDLNGATVLSELGTCSFVGMVDLDLATDCQDDNPTVYPSAPELCDGLDTDCDGSVPSNELDSDGDGFSECEGDCSDGEANRFPGNTEICDSIDNDCDLILPLDEQNLDGDEWMSCEGDCDDLAATVYPGALEVLDDGVDQDCSGADTVTCFVDDDGDSFGSSLTLSAADGVCTSAGRSEFSSDCDDTNSTVYPGAVEVGSCDGLDTDCDGLIPPNEADGDTDGVLECAGDCADDDPATFPGAPELCDGADNDCDSAVPGDEVDADEDGVLGCADCNDGDPETYPGAAEACDEQDNDCDGVPDPSEQDADSDGVMECAGDCADDDPATFPTAPELCDGVDNDCDSAVPVDEVDADQDGVLACADCDDGNPAINPNAPEACDGVDNDCNGSLPDLERRDDEGVLLCEKQPYFFIGDGCSASVAESQDVHMSFAVLVFVVGALRVRRRARS